MSISIKTLIAVLLILMSFAAALAVHADEVKPLSGTVDYVDPDESEIWINDEDGETLEIIGFPFHNLEVQLEEELGYPVTIVEGDCVSITYYVKDLSSGDEVNKWLSLTEYCEGCGDDCYGDEDGLEREPQGHQNKNRPNPWPWHGKPPGHRR